MDQLYIKKKSVVELPKATGSISDTLNVEDKITNAPSINLVTQMAGVPTDGIIEFEGDEIPEGYEEVEQKSIATFKTGDSHVEYTISTAYTPVMVKLEKKAVNIGSAFILNSDGSITINKDCFVKVSCNLMTSQHQHPILTVRYKNSNAAQLAEVYSFTSVASDWITMSISPIVMEFKKGDTIYMGVITQSVGTVMVASWHFSWITLEEV